MKKIAFIDHSFHSKTKSSFFMIDLLKQWYQVEIVFNDQWKTGQEPDVSTLDESYHAVIFWQSISYQMVKSVKCKNVVFFPMYDDSGGMPDYFWHKLSHVKIISFSKTLYKRVKDLGLKALYLQFYPEPIEVKQKSSKELSVFFWQRRNEIAWPLVKQILCVPNSVKKVHIHTAVDPGQTFVKPTMEDEKRYNITYSNWFDTKEEYIEVIRACDVYIAPRLYEGIGFSFLEAMAMGKAVIAADCPTMNEYIINGVNGFLFSPEQPSNIQIENLLLIQENAQSGIAAGRLYWEFEKEKVSSFIDHKPLQEPDGVVSAEVVTYGKNIENKKLQVLKEMIKSVMPNSWLNLYRKLKR